MNRDQITREDFPADGTGYDRASVDAHLAAVAAWTAALEAQIAALEVERGALRSRLAQDGERAAAALDASSPAGPAPPEPVEAGKDRPDDAEAESAPAPASGEDEEVSARLVATRLALEGCEQEEIVSRLAETYDLANLETLVQDVLDRLG